MKLTLTVEQRIRVSWFLGNQQGKLADVVTAYELRKKIELSPEEIQTFTVDAGNGARTINFANPDIKNSEVLEIETAEARDLKSRVEATTTFTCFDADWLLPVIRQIQL